MKQPPPAELEAIVEILPSHWSLSSLKWWAMGWIAELEAQHRRFQLVSDRGYIDVYELIDGKQRQILPPEEQRRTITPEQIQSLLTKA